MVELNEELRELISPLFELAAQGPVELNAEDFVDACKTMIKVAPVDQNSHLPQRYSIINKYLIKRSGRQVELDPGFQDRVVLG